MQKKIAVHATTVVRGSRYPAPYHEPCKNRFRRVLGDAASLTHFGANLTRLPSGTWSSQRHWHSAEDEFIYMLEGELVLVTDSGEEIIRAGDCVGFKAGNPDGHHLQNRSQTDVVLLEVGSRKADDAGDYSDIDMRFTPDGYTHKDGSPFS